MAQKPEHVAVGKSIGRSQPERHGQAGWAGAMDMDMHMFGAMYAPSDRVTMMLMTNYIRKEMDHVTYAGGMGTTVLGGFKTETSGVGDTSLTGLLSLHNSAAHKIHALFGLSFPTGSTDETGAVPTPLNTQPTLRLPYPMQLGSGSFDPIVGASYSGFGQFLAWGAQWRSTYRVEDNDDGYRLGDEHRLTGWISYLLSDPVSASLRLEYYKRENIEGIDPGIIAPVQTADPGRQGISRTNLSIGLNWAGQGSLFGYRLALEYSVPIQEDLDGPQLETDSQLMIGFQKAFY